MSFLSDDLLLGISSINFNAPNFDNRSKVTSIFSGINYLERLGTVETRDLLTSLTSGKQAATGDLISGAPDSIFNKFSVFKYAGFINGSTYQPQAHFIGYESNKSTDPNDVTSKLNAAANKKAIKGLATALIKKGESTSDIVNKLKTALGTRRAESAAYGSRNTGKLVNPTASNIIKWAATDSMQSVIGFQPYSMTDFMFCKNYGKIPNNRLITLRRYPYPMQDQLRSPGEKNPIPIAQAITWFGEGSDNKLSDIGVLKWNLKWSPLTVTEQNIDGNEVTLDQIIPIFTALGKGYKNFGDQLKKIYVAVAGKDAQLQQLSGMEGKFQEFAKNLYTDKGPYWNRVFGPVNVIHQSTRRDRGMQDGWDSPFTLKFHYSFRSFNGLSPKIVALDLISSFLNLTYNDAEFLGQLGRYFPKQGIKFSPTTEQLLGDILTNWATSFQAGNMDNIMQLADKMMTAIKTTGGNVVNSIKQGKVDDLITKGKGVASRVAQVQAITALQGAIPNLISARSALSDRPVGEWHIVVGNPLNPIMVMGDLCCTSCSLAFDEEMGPDDFPTGCTFTVGLKQGKPRDKVAIERMFNLGETKLLSSQLRNPSSASDTFGQENNKEYDAFSKEITKADIDNIQKQVPLTSFNQYRNRLRRSYKYAADFNGGSETDAVDSVLWLYYDRGQHKN